MNLRLITIFIATVLIWSSSALCFAVGKTALERTEPSMAATEHATVSPEVGHESMVSDEAKNAPVNNVVSMQDSINTELAGDSITS